MSAPRIEVLVGNPRPGSRTAILARQVAQAVAGPVGGTVGELIDLALLGGDVLDPHSSAAAQAVQRVRSADLLVVASPTYKATYTGLLKAFLDQLPGQGLSGVVAVPVMVAGAADHALAVEVHLRPLLVELGASVPARGLFLLESQLEDPSVLDPWMGTSRASLVAALGRTRPPAHTLGGEA